MLTARFIRHGESIGNIGAITGEPGDIPLTPRGRAQALAVAEALAEPPDLFVTSPYIRARDTAAPAAARHADVPLEVWPIHEICLIADARRINTNTPMRAPLFEALWNRADPAHCDGEGAECYTDFVGRARTMLVRLAALPPGRVVLFSHGLFLNGVRWEIVMGGLPVTPDSMSAFRGYHRVNPIDNAKGFTARWDGVSWAITE